MADEDEPTGAIERWRAQTPEMRRQYLKHLRYSPWGTIDHIAADVLEAAIAAPVEPREPFDFEAAMKAGWEGAMELIREEGDDPEDVVRKAAEALEYWSKRRAEPPTPQPDIERTARELCTPAGQHHAKPCERCATIAAALQAERTAERMRALDVLDGWLGQYPNHSLLLRVQKSLRTEETEAYDDTQKGGA